MAAQVAVPIVQVNVAQENVQTVMNAIHAKMNGQTPTVANILVAVASAMEAAVQIAVLSGDQKKQLVIQVVNAFIIQTVPNPEEQAALQAVVDALIGGAIDLLYNVSVGTIKFVESTSCWAKCCGKSSQ